MVSIELQQRVNARLAECLAKAEQVFGRKFKPANSVDYKLRGTTAGICKPFLGHLSFNAGLLVRNVDAFIHDTVAHELAHYIHCQMHPEDLTGKWGGKRDIHGYNWQRVMLAMGVDPTRCHKFDVSETRVEKSSSRRTATVVCGRCKAALDVTPMVYGRVAMGMRYKHNRCGGILATVAPTEQPTKTVFGGLTINHTGVDAPAPKPASTTAPKTTGRSKMDICRDLYRTMSGTKSRQEIIAAFINTAGCTQAGANTYYASLKAGK